jgi:hypothetical protein
VVAGNSSHEGSEGRAVAEQGRIAADRVWRAVIVATLVSVVLLSACSSDDPEAGASGERDGSTTTTAGGGTDGGTIDDTVPPAPTPTVIEAAIDAPADFGDGISARVVTVEDVEVDAFMPGEISGPGVAITVELANGSAEAVNLDNLSVELVMTGNRFATPITTQEDTRLVGDLGPGATGEGTYVFSISPEDRTEVAVQVNYAPPKPTILFQGSLLDV